MPLGERTKEKVDRGSTLTRIVEFVGGDLAHAPDHLHEEVSANYADMIYAETAKEIKERHKTFLRKWRLKCRAVVDSLEEARDRLFTFTRLPPSQWRSRGHAVDRRPAKDLAENVARAGKSC